MVLQQLFSIYVLSCNYTGLAHKEQIQYPRERVNMPFLYAILLVGLTGAPGDPSGI